LGVGVALKQLAQHRDEAEKFERTGMRWYPSKA
jgi:hypothetical protein